MSCKAIFYSHWGYFLGKAYGMRIFFFNSGPFYVDSSKDTLVFKRYQYSNSLGPFVNRLAIFANANILKNNRIKRYHIKVSVVRY